MLKHLLYCIKNLVFHLLLMRKRLLKFFNHVLAAMKMKTCANSTVSFLGLLFILFGVVSFFILPILIIHFIHQQLALIPNSETFEIWKDIPIPLYLKFYFFNVTNSVEIEKKGSKPVLKEVGPFTYQIVLKKKEIKENDDLLSFSEFRSYKFLPNLSIADENFQIVTINTPLAVSSKFMQDVSPAFGLLISLGLETASEGFFIKRKVKELLFEGYPEPLTAFSPLVNPSIPIEISGRFGYYFARNNSFTDSYQVNSGKNNLNQINRILKWNGKSNISLWGSDECNSFAGSTKGDFNSPVSNDVKNVKIFFSEICRVLKFTYNTSYERDDGLISKKFVLDKNSFKNAIDYPPNSCYDSQFSVSNFYQSFKKHKNSLSNYKTTILPSGVFDITKCKWGIPFFVSKPHFLDADSFYSNSIEGLRPNSSLHSFWVEIEPVTGLTISIRGRFQLNIVLGNGRTTFRHRNIPNIIFPIMWQELESKINPKFSFRLKLVQKLPMYIPVFTFYLFIFIGVVLILISLCLYIFPLILHRKLSIKLDKAKY